jgi:uncharacterized membrane protein YkoI
MRTLRVCLIVIVTLAWLGLTAPIRADEEKIDLDKLPKEVTAAVKKKFPDAKLVGAEKEVEKDKTTYEVSLKNKDQKIDVILTPEGKIIAIEAEITAKDLPKEVSAALDKKYPKAKIKVIEKITKDEKTSYEILLDTDKKTVEVVFDPKGKMLQEEVREKKEEKDK